MRIHVVDAFTDRAFAGNPAGVVLLEEPAPDAWMQAVAAEMKHAETAFVHLPADTAETDHADDTGDRPLKLRWFTPLKEVDLCGHATLAAAHVLGGDRRFDTRSGILTCTARDGWVEMDFPADPAQPIEITPPLRAGLPGVTITAAARAVSDVLVQAASAAQVRALTPDLAALSEVPGRGVIVTAPGDRPGLDVVSRCFYPSYGVPEDPVTGSAHCTLASWWAPKLGRAELFAEQASPRGGQVRATLTGDRVRLAGRAVTVLAGELIV
ncbi:PhzF family phenazine biosynthesis isomerase [Actinosynnema sp. NPDC047251]|uniref:Putative isomerase n=1 Tax=Saccharothrix espanaensis (strain ATCC 51144 / DSM 44229 / JCM 9112 / NBRC 15066 / NRRL 15764) TaxID=1179773 RepID=K0KA45_SACES|nr:PhzF family phenazine biosynthesis isomerase [Saccharothrix espanaensis]CCH35196.1 putative isomerase [Saccharothrix espanaensis DSM 44229]